MDSRTSPRDITPGQTLDENRRGFTIIWQDLTYTVRNSGWCKRGVEPKVILDDVCGHAKSGELTGIMGPSGAGKSTLLSCLFQGQRANTSGEILVEGKSPSDKLKICFIPQKDVLNEWLTVREDLIFVSRFNGTINQAEEQQTYVQGQSGVANFSHDHNRNACQVAAMLGLTSCLDVHVKNISGGQKKRLSLARELMFKPDVLVLDEPTTGLDSTSCLKIVAVLKKLVADSANPLAIVITIHQPERAVFSMLDHAYVLAKGGFVIYDDSPRGCLSTLASVANVSPAPRNCNPGSFLIEVSSDPRHEDARTSLSQHHRAKHRSNFPLQRTQTLVRPASVASMAGQQRPESTSLDQSHASRSTAYFMSPQLLRSNPAFSLRQNIANIRILTQRFWVAIWRDPSLTRSRIVFHIAMPVLMLLVFGSAQGKPNACPKLNTEFRPSQISKQVNSNKMESQIEEHRTTLDNSAFYTILYFALSVNALSISSSFYPQKINLFRKEVQNGLYSPVVFHLAKLLAEFPLELALPLSSALLIYYPSGQPYSAYEWRMLASVSMFFLGNYAMSWIGLLCGLVLHNHLNLAILVALSFNCMMVVFCGTVIRRVRMYPITFGLDFWTPLQRFHLSLMTIRYGFNLCDCTPDALAKRKTGILSPGLRDILDSLVEQDTNSTTKLDFPASQVFDKLTDLYNRAQTFGVEIKSCDDVRPPIMHFFGLQNYFVPLGFGYFIVMILLLQILSFFVLKSVCKK